MNSNSKKGMAGIITVVLIMALLASVSVSYIKLMETENSVTVFTEQHQKAADAAFCGISYAMAQLQTQKNLFKNSTNIKDRIYIVKPGKTKLASLDLTKPIDSKWNYMDETKMIINSEEIALAKPPYRFMVFTYPIKLGTTKPIDYDANPDKYEILSSNYYSKQYYMVKSKGEYFEYDNPNSDNPEVIATHTAQYLAQLKVDRSQKRVFLYRYKPVPYQSENEFYKYLSKMN